MSLQIAVRLSDTEVEKLDALVATGRYPSRAAAVRAGLDLLFREEREREIVEAYRRGYGAHPQEPELLRAGLLAGAALIRREEEELSRERRPS
jgi:Arc/MetJ-type ribon-helix-helix transcriptional regulator